eukprot:3054262-Amphidinium_carterae.2
MKEVEKGWLKGPLTRHEVDNLVGKDWLPVRRFPVKQATKLRPIDDGKECRLNEAVSIHNTLDVHYIDVCAATMRYALEAPFEESGMARPEVGLEGSVSPDSSGSM